MVIIHFLFVVLFLVLLVVGSDFFVKSASRIAKRIGVSELVIGLVLVASGTSIPEFTVAIFSSIKGHTEIIVGNIIGSNVADLSLITGFILLLYSGVKTNKLILKRDGYVMLLAAVLFFIFAMTGSIKWYMGVIFLLIYVGYLFILFRTNKGKEHKHHLEEHLKLDRGFGKDVLIFVLSCAAIFIGGRYIISEIIFLADYFRTPETTIGVLNAIGTTLPEFMVSIIAGRRKLWDLFWGNIIGSNITNIFLIIGTASLISPIKVIPLSLYFAIPLMVFLTMLFLIFIATNWKASRKEGAVLFALYFVFIFGLFYLSL